MALIGISGKMQSGKNTVASIIQYLTSDDCSEQCLPRLKHGLDIQGFHNSHWKQVAFAGKLKQIVSILTGIPVEDLEKQEVKDRVLGEEWNRVIAVTPTGNIEGDRIEIQTVYKKLKVRQLLQEVGTNAMRDVIHPNIWVNALFADYKGKNYIDKPLSEEIKNKYMREGKYNIPSMQRTYLEEEVFPNWIITDMRFPNEMEAIKQRGGITIRVNRPGLVENNHLSETSLDLATFDFTIINNGSIEELIEKVKEILIKNQLI